MTARDAVHNHVCAHPGVNVPEISAALGMTRAAVRAALLRLERKGFVQRNGGKWSPADEAPRRGLVRDESGIVCERRRFDCVNLHACEEDWIANEATRAKQGACPVGCGYYKQAEAGTRQDVSIQSGADGAVW